jgi:ubiquinone/menaquinone biosynthesis C-methylase UbiE
VLHHFDDIKSAISEIKRVMKKSGQLTAVEPLAHQHHHGPQLSETGWKALFEDVGFHVETESLEGAVVIRAKK